MFKTRVFGVPLFVIAIGVGIGIFAGSLDRLRNLSRDVIDESASVEMQNIDQKDASTDGRAPLFDGLAGEAIATNRKLPRELEDYIEEDVVFDAADGVSLVAARHGSSFLGYKIVGQGVDERLRNGMIIVAINGIPVEDSAAGTELLVAAMSNRSADITLQEPAAVE